jgi:hypothetical protein
MSLILDGTNGLSDVDGSAATPAIRGSDANTGVFFDTDIVGVSTDGTERVRVDASGNVGIGTSSPSGASGLTLAINGGAGQTRFALKNTASGDTASDGFQIALLSDGANVVYQNRESGYQAWENGGSERARIDSSGNLLVNTTSAIASAGYLQVSGATSTQNGIGIKATGSGTQFLAGFYNSASTVVGSINTNGTTTAYSTSSDYRLKENIAPMTGALAKVAALKPVTYSWKQEFGGEEGQGFIAHELQAVVPECVTGEKDAVDAEGNPQYQGIDTSFLVATLTAAIQEQQAIITALTARVEAQEVRLTSLEGAQA